MVIASIVCLSLGGAAVMRDVGWPHTAALGLSLLALVVILGGYIREARGERADYLSNMSKYFESIGKAVGYARGDK